MCTHPSVEIVSVIDTTSNRVVATLPIAGEGKRYVAMNPAGTRVYVTSEFSNTVSVIDTATNALVGTVPVVDPTGIAVNPAGTRAYVAGSENNGTTLSVNVSVIDTSTNSVVATIPITAVNCAGYFACPALRLERGGIAVHPSGKLVYVTTAVGATPVSNAVNAVSVVSTETNSVQSAVPVTGSPQGVAMHPSGSTVYVAGGTISVIDTATNTVSATVSGTSGFEIAIAQGVGVPNNLRAIPGNQMVDLRWDSTSEDVRGWNVYYRVRSAIAQPWNRIPSFATPNDSSAPTTITLSYRVEFDPLNPGIKLLTNGTLYEFSVTAVSNSGAESQKSASVDALPRIGSQYVGNQKLPVLFLHGIWSDATTWDGEDGIKEFLTKTFGWKFGGNLEIVPYGQIDVDPLRVCTFENPCAQFSEGGNVEDFYTATFFDKNANYGNGLGIIQQGREVRTFLQKLHELFPTGQKFRIVAHSMGGLAARSYTVGLNTSYEYDVYNLVTYGTPHKGTPLSAILNNQTFFAKLNDWLLREGITTIDIFSDGIRDMEPPSDFLSQLSSKSLKASRYQSILSIAPRPCFGDAIADDQLNSILGSSDCVVPTDYQDLRNIVFINPPDINRVSEYCCAHSDHLSETKDYTTILSALGESLVVVTRSPVDVEIVDPQGFRITKSLNEIPGASYQEFDMDGDGKPNDIVSIPFPLAGNYAVHVIPEAGAAPTDTYTLEVTQNGQTTVLAQNQKLQDIPSEPFLVNTPWRLTIDIKPGTGPNCINATSKGTTTVAVLAKGVDVAMIIVSSVEISGDSNPSTVGIIPTKVSYSDVDGDGKKDLVLQFSTPALNNAGILTDGKELFLKGNLNDGTPLVGSDIIFLAGGPNCS